MSGWRDIGKARGVTTTTNTKDRTGRLETYRKEPLKSGYSRTKLRVYKCNDARSYMASLL